MRYLHKSAHEQETKMQFLKITMKSADKNSFISSSSGRRNGWMTAIVYEAIIVSNIMLDSRLTSFFSEGSGAGSVKIVFALIKLTNIIELFMFLTNHHL